MDDLPIKIGGFPWRTVRLLMMIYLFDWRSKGPCRDCPLQRPPGPQGSNMRRRESFFLFFSEFAKVFFVWAKDFAKDFDMRPPQKINVGFGKDLRT